MSCERGLKSEGDLKSEREADQNTVMIEPKNTRQKRWGLLESTAADLADEQPAKAQKNSKLTKPAAAAVRVHADCARVQRDTSP